MTAKCPLTEYKMISIKTMKREKTGKKPCNFVWTKQISKPIVFIVPPVDPLILEPDIKKSFRLILKNKNIDRNELIYRTRVFEDWAKHDKETDNKQLLEQAKELLKKIDIDMLHTIYVDLSTFKKMPKYETINKLIWITNKYIDKEIFFKINNYLDIRKFYKNMKRLYNKTKIEGFVYFNPYPKPKVCTPKPLDPFIKRLDNKETKKNVPSLEKIDPLMQPLVHPQYFKQKIV